MNSLAFEIYIGIISLISCIFFVYIMILVIDFLKNLKKYLDLKIIEMEIKLDQDKF